MSNKHLIERLEDYIQGSDHEQEVSELREILDIVKAGSFDEGVRWTIEYYEDELGIHSGLSHDYDMNGTVEDCEECN